MTDQTPPVLEQFQNFYEQSDANEAVAEAEARFLRAGAAERRPFVDGLRVASLEDSINMRERAERVALHRHFANIDASLRRLGR